MINIHVINVYIMKQYQIIMKRVINVYETGEYKNHKLLDNEEIEIEFCFECGCYTLNHIVYNDVTMYNYECLKCAPYPIQCNISFYYIYNAPTFS